MSSVIKITLNRYHDLYGSNPVAPLYVVNLGKPRGNVAFNCRDDVGSPVAVLVPATFIPVDLTEQITRDALLKSSEFRRLLSNNYIAIVKQDSAEAYLQGNLAKAELKRLRKFSSDVDEAMGTVQGDDEELEITLDGSKPVMPVFESDSNTREDAFVASFLAQSEDPEVTDADLEAQFLSMGIDLPKEHLERLAASVSRSAVRELIMQAM